MADPRPRSERTEKLNSDALESLVGYNARRAWSAINVVFSEQMAVYGLKEIDFAVLSLLAHNPGATSRQLCATLSILPPNLVSLVGAMDSRGLITRQAHPHDGRAIGLHLTTSGQKLVREAEQTVNQLELQASASLTASERRMLIGLLKKIYAEPTPLK